MMASSELLAFIGRTCQRLQHLLSGLTEGDRNNLLGDIMDSSNPKNAASRLDDLLKDDSREYVSQILAAPQMRRNFLAGISGSRFLVSALNRNPALLDALFLKEGLNAIKDRVDFQDDLNRRLEGVFSKKDLDRTLRRYKDEEYLRIGLRDLSGLSDVRGIMRELSDLAAASVTTAMEFHWRLLTAMHGLPPGCETDKGFAIFGMGKISGRELNFSSDVDLIFLRRKEEGKTEGPQRISVARFYESLARAVTASLSNVTDDGFVFRVDLRLRPDGERGELVPALSNALEYYWGWGRTWERAAMMKAILISGDSRLAEDFMKGLEPFIYQKHLDYSTIEDMREMKLAIESQLRRKPGINIKLGHGGIREIEFFVQALQIINGGRKTRVRTPSTVEALARLAEADLLDDETARELTDAYLFFRMVEHRIQINHQLQTHELPRTKEEQEDLARRMGYRENALESFNADLDRRRRLVEELFSGMFHTSGEEPTEVCSARTRQIVDAIHDEDRAVQLLRDHNFESPAESYPLLKSLVEPADRRYCTERGCLLLEKLAPMFVDALLESPEPGKSLLALDKYITSLSSRSTYFSTLLNNPPTVRFLVRILGESRFFAELLARHPQTIDSLIGRGAGGPLESYSDLVSNLQERLAYCENFEAQLDVLRIFKNEHILKIGVRHLTGDLDSLTARKLVTELAEAILGQAVGLAHDRMRIKFGDSGMEESIPFVILGMGKLGGKEMSYLSDLDVIFIYDSPSDNVAGLSAHEWFTRLATRIISILSVPTSEGIAFEIDARLRPSGNKGPLVSSLSAFREYHETTSKLWEKQALTKARPVYGPPSATKEVASIIRECIERTELTREDLGEMARLRTRMENELAQEDKSHVDLKTGHGGLVDVEFYVQANVLMHARDTPEALKPNTLGALRALRLAGRIDEDASNTLESGYRFLIDIEDRLRIMEHRSVDRVALEGAKLKGLAQRLGYKRGGEERLVEDYFRVTRDIRRIYDSLFAQADPPPQ